MNPPRKRRPARPEPAEALRERLVALEASGEAAKLDFRQWSERVPEPKSGTLDFERFPFQRELYESGADDREIVVKKATQVGVSAHCIRWATYWPEQAGLTALYVFPYQRQLGDFSAARVQPLLKTPFLSDRVADGGVRNAGLVQIGRGHLYLRGSESAADLQSVDADVLVLDEYDLLAPAHVPDAERRLGASDYGLIRRVGVPSFPGLGIAELYERSDRRSWQVRCASCNEWQPVSFAENIDCERGLRVCRRCRRELDVGRGQWVAEYPDRDIRGYHIPRLIVPRLDVAALVRDSRATDPARRQAFHNKDLAEEWAAEDARLTAAVIEAAQRDHALEVGYAGANPVTMGVDVASVRTLHVRISEHLPDGRKRALFIGEARDFAELDGLMDRYRVLMCAIDSLPERRLAQMFADRFPGRVYLVSYATAPTAEPISAIDDEARRVTVARVDLIDEALDLIRRQRNLLPRFLPPDYVRHLQSVIRGVDRNELGRVRPVYRSVGPDDFLHAEVYDVVAAKLVAYRLDLAELERTTYVTFEEADPDFERSCLHDALADELLGYWDPEFGFHPDLDLDFPDYVP